MHVRTGLKSADWHDLDSNTPCIDPEELTDQHINAQPGFNLVGLLLIVVRSQVSLDTTEISQS